MEIILLEGTGKLLSAMSEASSVQSRTYLEKMGVRVMTETLVRNYDGEVVELMNGNRIPARLVIWAAGVRGNIPSVIDPSLVVRGNRVKVDRFHAVQGMAGVYALGDASYMETPLYPNGHPQVANVAVSQAVNLYRNLSRSRLNAQALLIPYEYPDKGSMATVGRNKAVVDIPKPRFHFGGFFAWMVWMSLHLLLLLGVRNRVQVFVNWLFNYITFDPDLRLIFREFYKPRKKANRGSDNL